MRRLAVALLALAGVVVAAVSLAAPAASQVANPVTITAVNPNCSPVGVRQTVQLTGLANSGASGTITVTNPTGATVASSKFVANGSGQWTTTFAFAPAVNGYYNINATDGSTQDNANYSAPCRSPHVTLTPACSNPGVSQTLTVNAFDFAPTDYGYAYYAVSGSGSEQSRSRIPTDASGNFATSATYKSTPFTVTPPNAPVTVRATDTRGNVVDIQWSPCPPPGQTTTTSTSTTTTTVVTDSTTTTLPPETIPTPTTRPGATTTTLLVTTTTLLVPPPTPGATLTVKPTLGTPGFVALATGTGFAPGPLQLTWAPGIGSFAATAGPDGTFTAQVLVFPHDRLGPRTLVATGGAVTATAPFLVVPNTVHPSGKDVTQITRLRSFNQR